jgi:hypothetical protein
LKPGYHIEGSKVQGLSHPTGCLQALRVSCVRLVHPSPASRVVHSSMANPRCSRPRSRFSLGRSAGSCVTHTHARVSTNTHPSSRTHTHTHTHSREVLLARVYTQQLQRDERERRERTRERERDRETKRHRERETRETETSQSNRVLTKKPKKPNVKHPPLPPTSRARRPPRESPRARRARRGPAHRRASRGWPVTHRAPRRWRGCRSESWALLAELRELRVHRR